MVNWWMKFSKIIISNELSWATILLIVIMCSHTSLGRRLLATTLYKGCKSSPTYSMNIFLSSNIEWNQTLLALYKDSKATPVWRLHWHGFRVCLLDWWKYLPNVGTFKQHLLKGCTQREGKFWNIIEVLFLMHKRSMIRPLENPKEVSFHIVHVSPCLKIKTYNESRLY